MCFEKHVGLDDSVHSLNLVCSENTFWYCSILYGRLRNRVSYRITCIIWFGRLTFWPQGQAWGTHKLKLNATCLSGLVTTHHTLMLGSGLTVICSLIHILTCGTGLVLKMGTNLKLLISCLGAFYCPMMETFFTELVKHLNHGFNGKAGITFYHQVAPFA